jgi:hypothetical protein
MMTVLLTFYIGFFKPAHNWDMIGYVASVYKSDGLSNLDLLEATYSDVENEVGAEKFSVMTTGDWTPSNFIKEDKAFYRPTVYNDYKSLEQQLPFYTPRVIYIALVKVAGIFGLSYSVGTYLVSSIFACASVLVIAVMLKQLSLPIYALPFLVVFSGLLQISRLSTPDAMACFFSLAALSAFLSGRSYYLALAVLLPLVRTDFIILSVLLAFIGFFTGRRLASTLAASIAVILYLGVNKLMGNYGWLTIFNFTLIGIDPYPADIIVSNSLVDYVRPYLSAGWNLVNHSHGIIYLLSLFIFFHLVRKTEFHISSMYSAVLVSLLFVVLHLMAFPAYMHRFFTFAVIICLIFIFSSIRKLLLLKQHA